MLRVLPASGQTSSNNNCYTAKDYLINLIMGKVHYILVPNGSFSEQTCKLSCLNADQELRFQPRHGHCDLCNSRSHAAHQLPRLALLQSLSILSSGQKKTAEEAAGASSGVKASAVAGVNHINCRRKPASW